MKCPVTQIECETLTSMYSTRQHTGALTLVDMIELESLVNPEACENVIKDLCGVIGLIYKTLE